MEEKKLTKLDLRIAVAAAICVLTATILNELNLKFAFGQMRLEVIQKMTAAIACLLCCQDNMMISRKAGVNRIIITFIGGLLAILLTLVDMAIGNVYISVILLFVGLLGTLYLCKCAKVPYINARIGGVTFILVYCTMAGNARIYYGIFRLVSTIYGVLVTLVVTWVFEKIFPKKLEK